MHVIRGINIGSRFAKSAVSAWLSTLNQTISVPSGKLEQAWLIGKKKLCIRFNRPLTIQTLITRRTVLARNSKMPEERPFARFGDSPLTSKLLISKEGFGDTVRGKTATAKAKIATGMKKALSFAQNKVRQGKKAALLSFKTKQDDQTEIPEQFDIEFEPESEARTAPGKPPNIEAQESQENSVPVEVEVANPILKPKQQPHHLTPTECLTCEKLIHCTLRAEMSADAENNVDIAPCRLETECTLNNPKH